MVGNQASLKSQKVKRSSEFSEDRGNSLAESALTWLHQAERFRLSMIKDKFIEMNLFILFLDHFNKENGRILAD